MASRFVNVDRDTPMLLPVDMRDWVPEDDLVHFVIETIEALNLDQFKVNLRGTGNAQYPPAMMLCLLVYCYCNGIFGSRRIERGTYVNLCIRYITGGHHPDHDTICSFRRENFHAVSQCFVHILQLAQEMGLLKVGNVSVDGSRINGNASIHHNVTYERAGELIEDLDQQVKELLTKAEEADQSEDADPSRSLPQEIKRRKDLRAKLQEARRKLEERAKAKAQAERAEYERKLKERQQREGRRKGPKPKEPSAQPKADEQINLTDSDTRIMRKNKRAAFQQAYNAQSVVDADGSQLVLGARVSQSASDSNELQRDIQSVPEPFRKQIQAALADSGFLNEKDIHALEQMGINPYVAIGAEAAAMGRQNDLRPRHKRSEKPSEPKSACLRAMKEKLASSEGKALYAKRNSTVEPVFGIIKKALGFGQFLLRGFEKVQGEWLLVSLAYNFKRLFNLKVAQTVA